VRKLSSRGNASAPWCAASFITTNPFANPSTLEREMQICPFLPWCAFTVQIRTKRGIRANQGEISSTAKQSRRDASVIYAVNALTLGEMPPHLRCLDPSTLEQEKARDHYKLQSRNRARHGCNVEGAHAVAPCVAATDFAIPADSSSEASSRNRIACVNPVAQTHQNR